MVYIWIIFLNEKCTSFWIIVEHIDLIVISYALSFELKSMLELIECIIELFKWIRYDKYDIKLNKCTNMFITIKWMLSLNNTYLDKIVH
jgi:hypothetical protein